MNRKPASRSPLKARPLRQAGQSITEELDSLLHDQVLPHFIVAGTFVVITLLEWLRWYMDAPPMPIPFTVVTTVMVAWLIIKLRRLLPKTKALKLGRDGEKAVGEVLERLRSDGYAVFHDLVGENFNIDHVLIGPAGVFIVETKTISKPTKGKPEVIFDGERITVGGFTPDRDPVTQAKAQVVWLRELIEESTGKRVPVKAAVSYPGWFVNSKVSPLRSTVSVVNPKGFAKLLASLGRSLSDEDVKLIQFHLSRYMRMKEGELNPT